VPRKMIGMFFAFSNLPSRSSFLMRFFTYARVP
jgi:hypothetical protein